MSSTHSERGSPSRFLIVGVQRSGTTVTHTTLSGHPDVAMPHEEVRSDPFFTRGRAVFTWGKESFVERRNNYTRLFDFLAHDPAVENAAARGFKVAVGDSQSAVEVANCVRDYLTDLRIVLVTRSDLVAQFGSLLRAQASGEWHLWEGAKANAGPLVTIDRDRFVDYVRDVRVANAQLRSLRDTHALLELQYERDIAPGIDTENLFRFLGLNPVPVTWTTVGKVAPPPQDYIQDYAELTAVQQGVPEPSAAEVAELATARRHADALAETATFLGHRAWHRVTHGQIDDAARDLALAIQKRVETPMDASLQGYLRGAFECEPLAVARADVADHLAVLDREMGRVPRYRTSRALLRIDRGRFQPVLDDMVDLLRHESELPKQDVEGAFLAVYRSLVGLADEGLAQSTIDALADRHGGSELFVVLDARLMQAFGRVDAAVQRAEAHLAEHPTAKAVESMLGELRSARERHPQ